MQQETSKTSGKITRAGHIRPKEPTTVYVTEYLAGHKWNGYKAGDPVELHRVTAERWVKSGKATWEDPNAKTKKEDKK